GQPIFSGAIRRRSPDRLVEWSASGQPKVLCPRRPLCFGAGEVRSAPRRVSEKFSLPGEPGKTTIDQRCFLSEQTKGERGCVPSPTSSAPSAFCCSAHRLR